MVPVPVPQGKKLRFLWFRFRAVPQGKKLRFLWFRFHFHKAKSYDSYGSSSGSSSTRQKVTVAMVPVPVSQGKKLRFLWFRIQLFDKLRFRFHKAKSYGSYGSGSNFLTSYGSGSTRQKVTVPVAQHWPVGVLPCPALLNGLPGEALQQPEENARLHAYQGACHSRTQHAWNQRAMMICLTSTGYHTPLHGGQQVKFVQKIDKSSVGDPAPALDPSLFS
jgi:hypothetical protein